MGTPSEREAIQYCLPTTDNHVHTTEDWGLPVTETTNNPHETGIIPDLGDGQFFPLQDDLRDKYQPKSTTRIMREAACHSQPAIASYRIHLDGGANMSITNDANKLVNFRNIKRHAIAGVADGGPALYATGIGYLPWRSSEGHTLLVKCYYSLNAAETVISPNDIVLNHISDYSGWTQHSDMDEGSGYVAFHHRNKNTTTKFHLSAHNGLWYNHVLGFTDVPVCRLMEHTPNTNFDCIRKMSSMAEYALLHNRTGHACDDVTESLHKHLTDCPKVKRNHFFKCPACMTNKAKHRPFNQAAGQPTVKQNARTLMIWLTHPPTQQKKA